MSAFSRLVNRVWTRREPFDLAARGSVEPLESRLLLSATVTQPIAAQSLAVGTSTTLDLFRNVNDTSLPTRVHFDTSQGSFDVQLFDAQAPRTVANFVHYVATGRDNNTVVHRSIAGFIVQAGAFDINLQAIPADRRVINEFNVSNTRGTIALAKDSRASGGSNSFFFNTADNSSNLDNQNSGFTAFGQVLGNGMQVVDQINALTTTTVSGLSDFPVLHNPPVGSADFVKINSVSLTPELTITATSDNPSVVNTGTSGMNLTLTAGATQGTANVTVNATDVNSVSVVDTFAVTVGTVDVAIGGAAPASVQFTDADGTSGTVSIKGPGTATVRFSGSNLVQAAAGKAIAVTGDAVKIALVSVSDSEGLSSALSFTARGGDGVIEVGGVNVVGALKSIAGKGVIVNGDLVVGATISKIDLRSMTNGTIDLGGGADFPSITNVSIGSVQDADLVSSSPIKALKVTSWTNTDSLVDLVSAAALGKLTVSGDFAAGLDLAGAQAAQHLGSAKVGGQASSGKWRVVGDAGKISIGSVAAGWTGLVTGTLAGLTVSNDFAGDVTAAAITSMKVGGSMTGSNVTLTQALSGTTKSVGKMTIGGAASNVHIRSTDNLGTISVGSLSDSTIYAGVNTEGGALPSAAGDFSNSANIAALTVKGKGSASFIDSDVAAFSLGKLSLGVVRLANAGVPFGIAGNIIASLTTADDAGHSIKLKNLDDPAAASAQIAALGFGLGDFVIRVV